MTKQRKWQLINISRRGHETIYELLFPRKNWAEIDSKSRSGSLFPRSRCRVSNLFLFLFFFLSKILRKFVSILILDRSSLAWIV